MDREKYPEKTFFEFFSSISWYFSDLVQVSQAIYF
jgi:hypothetical protein